MVSIGDTTLPGVSATVDSANAVATNISSPGDVGIVGGADLSSGSANAEEVYRVTTAPQAGNLFGAGSPLAKNVSDALSMGAFPVYAAAAGTSSVTDEDISGLGSTSGTLAEGPVVEDAASATFTVDGTGYTTILTLEDPSTKSPSSEEVYLNPVTQAFELGTAPSTSGTVDYDYESYDTALSAIDEEYGEVVDFVGTTTENDNVSDIVESTVDGMESKERYAIGVAGAAANIADTSAYSNRYDNSRMIMLYPSRNSDGESVVGSYLGLRAAIGIQTSAMKQRLRNQKSLSQTLTRLEKQDLDGENVVALANESRGAVVVNDVTCVADGNSEEAQMKDSLSRLIVDYVTEVTFRISDSFIGGYNSPSTQNQLKAVLNSRISAIQETDAILNFTLSVEEVDAYTAKVNLSVETVKPLRNVVAAITAGEVEGPAAVSA